MNEPGLISDEAARLHIGAALAAAEEHLQTLTHQLHALRAQQDTLHRHATQLQHFLALGHELLGDDPSQGSPDAGQASKATQTTLPLLSPPQPGPSLAMATRQLLEAVHQPLSVTAITDALQAQGYLKGQWPKATLRSMFSKNLRLFTRTPQGDYALTAWRPTPTAPRAEHGSDEGAPPGAEAAQDA